MEDIIRTTQHYDSVELIVWINGKLWKAFTKWNGYYKQDVMKTKKTRKKVDKNLLELLLWWKLKSLYLLCRLKYKNSSIW